MPAAADIFDQVSDDKKPSGDIFDQVMGGDAAPQKLTPPPPGTPSVPRPPVPRELTGPPNTHLVQTSPYMPGAPARFEEMGVGETPASKATTEASQQGVSQAFGAQGYPKMLSGAKKLAATGVAPGSTYYTPPQHVPTPAERLQQLKGASELISGAGEAATPFMAEGIAERPVSAALGIGAGYLASKGAKAATKAVGGGPEAQELAETLGFWAPTFAGTLLGPKVGIESSPEGTRGASTVLGGKAGVGFEATPEGVTVRGKVGSFSGSKTFSRGPQPAPGLEPPTIEADPATEAMAKRDQTMHAAERVANGLPPVEPPPPEPTMAEDPNAPPSVQQGAVSPEDVGKMAKIVAGLPPEIRPQVIRESHGKLSQVLLEQGQQGPVVLPNGKLALIKSPEDAEKHALEIINSAVEEHDKAAVAPENAATPAPRIPNPKAIKPRDIFDQVADSGVSVGSGTKGTAESTQEPSKPQEALTIEGNGVESPNGTAPEVVQRTPDSGQPLSTSGSTAPERGGNNLSLPSEGRETPVPVGHENQVSGAEVPAAGEPGKLAKGDSATLSKDISVNGKTIPKGTRATIAYVHPGGLIIRAVSEAGEKISRGVGSFTKGELANASHDTPQGAATSGISFPSKESGLPQSNQTGVAAVSNPAQSEQVSGAKGNGAARNQGTSLGTERKEETEAKPHPSQHFLDQYNSDKSGFVDRYLASNTAPAGHVLISADRARSLFPEYSSSKEAAFENTESTNAAASRIASAAFDRVIESGNVKGKQVEFITGMPGAGKSTAENASVNSKRSAAMIYEGNLSDPALLQRRVKAVLDAGGRPTIYYVKAPAKAALDRMLARQEKIGRYVPIEYGAKVAANTPASIEALHAKYGDAVQYRAIDNSGKPEDAKLKEGIDAIRGLAENRSSDAIRDEQLEHADKLRAEGKLPEKLYERIKPQGDGGSARLGDVGEHQETPTGSLTRSRKGEAGFVTPDLLVGAPIAAVTAVHDYLKPAIEYTHKARDLQRSLDNLDSQKDADILRGVNLFKKLLAEGLTKEGDSHLYHFTEDPEGEGLTSKEEDLLDQGQPLLERNADLFTELKKNAVPVEGYIHRVVRGKNGMLDRIAQGTKSIGKKNTLSKSAPQTKHRTYMALESVGKEPTAETAAEPGGKRLVVSIKSGKTTVWNDGKPSDVSLHPLRKEAAGQIDKINDKIKALEKERSILKATPSRTQVTFQRRKRITEEIDKLENERDALHADATKPGSLLVDQDGKVWHLKQATTREIEANTETRYHHSFFASTIASNIQLESAVRAMHFLEDFKASADFKELAFEQDKGNPPKGWKKTNLPQFSGYYFEPRTAEVLDNYYSKLQSEGPGILGQIGNFMRMAMLLNPIRHPLNVAASWAVERGASGFLLPSEYKTLWRTGGKAIKATLSKNEDFQLALRAGAALQSHRAAVADIQKLFFDQLADGLGKEEPWAMKIAKSLGIEHGNLLNLLHKPSSAVAWNSSDIMMLQSGYAYQEKHPEVSLEDAFKEVGKYVPEYRIPTRILDSRFLAKLMGERWATVFGGYRYGLLKGLAEVGKSALGAGSSPEGGDSKAKEIAKGWDRLAMIGLILFGMKSILDEVAKKVTGDPNATFWRVGPFGLIQAAIDTAEHRESVSQLAQRVATPAPLVKSGAQLATNRKFDSGQQIYDPHQDFSTQTEQIGRYLLGEAGQIGQYEHAATGEQKRKFWESQLGVTFRKSNAGKMASDIAATKVGTEAESPEDESSRVLRRDILDELRKGNREPLHKALSERQITSKQAHELERRAKLTELQDHVHGFSYGDARKVYDAATPEERRQLDPIMREKRSRLLSQGRGKELVAR